MSQQVKVSMRGLGLSLVVAMALASPPAWAGVDIDVNIGIPLPPPIEVEAPPAMVYLPEPGVYVAVGIPFDLFFIGGTYYYSHGGYWYGSRGYNGPWVHMGDRSIPRGLRRYKVERLHQFREREFHRYTSEGPRYRGRHFRAVPGPGSRGQSKAGPGSKGRGKGRHKEGGGRHNR
jgi:hypothetical protein